VCTAPVLPGDAGPHGEDVADTPGDGDHQHEVHRPCGAHWG